MAPVDCHPGGQCQGLARLAEASPPPGLGLGPSCGRGEGGRGAGRERSPLWERAAGKSRVTPHRVRVAAQPPRGPLRRVPGSGGSKEPSKVIRALVTMANAKEQENAGPAVPAADSKPRRGGEAGRPQPAHARVCVHAAGTRVCARVRLSTMHTVASEETGALLRGGRVFECQLAVPTMSV